MFGLGQGMESGAERTGRVAVGEDKFAVPALEQVGGDNGFEEQRHQAAIVASRAVPRHHLVRVGHVRIVVFPTVHLSVPAAREHELQPEAVGAVLIEERLVRHEMPHQRPFRWKVRAVVQTSESQRPLLKQGLGFAGPGSQRV